MKILITIFAPPSGAMGPHTRTVAVGVEARKQGHQVAFCCSPKIAAPLVTTFARPARAVQYLEEYRKAVPSSASPGS